jgi:hypothetical protein
VWKIICSEFYLQGPFENPPQYNILSNDKQKIPTESKTFPDLSMVTEGEKKNDPGPETFCQQDSFISR